MSVQEDNIKIVRDLCDIVNKRDLDKMLPLFAENFKDNNPAWSLSSMEELKQIISAAHESLDMFINQDDVFASESGEKVTALITFHGKHIGPFLGVEPTNKEVSWTSTEVFLIENGKIVERWVQADTAGLMRQLGIKLPG